MKTMQELGSAIDAAYGASLEVKPTTMEQARLLGRLQVKLAAAQDEWLRALETGEPNTEDC